MRKKKEYIEWNAPKGLFEELNKEFQFSIDLYASPKRAKCFYYYKPEDDSLNQPWYGTCWCNPPRTNIQKWVEKAYNTAKKNNGTVVMLIPYSPTDKWYKEFVEDKAEVRLDKKYYPVSNSGKHTRQGIIVAIYRMGCV